MALPNYLAKIKSSGMYRFVWDKSEIPGVEEQTLRLVVGYSEKGPFNTPVYIESQSQFKTVYGNISKKLERYGCFFHRLALQALTAGPIIALNLKTFGPDEKCQGVAINPSDALGIEGDIETMVRDIYDTNRFWKLEPEHLEDIEAFGQSNKYVLLTHTDSDNVSNTIFMRGLTPSNYNITFKEWYSAVLNGTDLPTYIQAGGPNEDKDYSLRKLDQYFAEIYVFRGQFTKEICTSENLAKYFIVDGDDIKLRTDLTNAFNEPIDTLEALSQNSASNFINKYQGILLPEFQSATGSILSLDQIFNSDFDNHKMMMRFNQAALYSGDITLDDLDTTGWTAASLENSTTMMSVTVDSPFIVRTEDEGKTYIPETTEEPVYYQFDMQLVPADNEDTEESDEEVGTVNKYHTTSDIVKMGFEKGQYYLGTGSTNENPDGKNVVILIDFNGESQNESAANNASSYQYDPEYAYNGQVDMVSTRDEDTKQETVAITYTNTQENILGGDAMRDMARILGAFYRGNNGKYNIARYKDEDYTWDVKGQLKGSNYKKDNTTLVSVITADYSDPC